jgi:16S rRNA (guanine527-N7)-methyltransferase
VSGPERSLVLLDASQRRTAFLREAVERLDISSRVEVITARAEAAARDPHLRGRFDAVVARSFGPPAVTAECAAGFLPAGGVLLVSEPPSGEDTPVRWPDAGLADLGFGPAEHLGHAPAGLVRIRRLHEHDRWPRRVGIPAKRPLW